MSKHLSRASAVRWMKFNFVGAIGIVGQLGMLMFLTEVLRVEYMIATALAVESAVLHNFVWHERFTWADRSSRRWPDVSLRFLRFNLTTGAVSIGGNVLLMRLLVGQLHLRPLVANLASIALCSLVNFLVSDRWVFRAPPSACGAEPNGLKTRSFRQAHRQS